MNIRSEYSEDKCLIKTGEWTYFAGDLQYNEQSLQASSCKNLGCHRGMVQRGLQVCPSGTTLMGLLASKERTKDNEITIKPNPWVTYKYT